MNATVSHVTIELPFHQMLALAQFAKRVGWTDIRANTIDLEEAHEVREALHVLQKALAEEGFAPR
jgi:hypothetical protein